MPSSRTSQGRTRLRPSCVWVLAAAAALVTAASGQDAPDGMRERGQRLLNRLHAGEPIRVVAFGDSLTDGWGTDGWNVYHRLVVDGLGYCYPGSPLELIIHGHPGETTADALRRATGEVLQARPNLVFVQFGGNDRGTGRSVEAFTRDLRQVLALIRDGTTALVIACLPPMVDPDPRNAWNEAARGAAAAEGIPTADFDWALRVGDGDCRGPFPHGNHPGSFTHALFAREVAGALAAALGVAPALQWRVLTGSRVSADASYPVEVEALNTSKAPVVASFGFEHGGQRVARRVQLAPGAAQTLREDVPLPISPFAGRSYSLPVRLLVQDVAPFAADARWLTVAPAIRADVVEGGGVEPGAMTWHSLGPESLTTGRHEWLGPADLSARFAVVVQPDQVVCTIEVNDDALTTASLQDPARGDSVEVYLDLRPDPDQGKPVYGPEVVLLQVIPPVAERGFLWRSMEPLPEALSQLSVGCELAPAGYTVTVSVPLATLKALRGPVWEGFGLDIGVNDADHGGTRKSQMMWAGTADNYLNPAYLGGVYTREVPPGATRQTLH